MLSRSHLHNAWFQHNLVGYGCSPKAMWRSQPLHIHTQASLYWNSHITEANELSAWNDRLRAHQLICLLTCIPVGQWQFHWQETASLTLLTKSWLTAQNNTPDELNTRLSLGKGTLRQFFESRWPATHQGHHDLKVGENYPDPTCLAPQKMWHSQTNSWLIGSFMVMIILHTSPIPPWGMLQFFRMLGKILLEYHVPGCHQLCKNLSMMPNGKGWLYRSKNKTGYNNSK